MIEVEMSEHSSDANDSEEGVFAEEEKSLIVEEILNTSRLECEDSEEDGKTDKKKILLKAFNKDPNENNDVIRFKDFNLEI